MEGIGIRSPGGRFMEALRDAIKNAEPYLKERRNMSVEKLKDMNCFFDRLLTKLLEVS